MTTVITRFFGNVDAAKQARRELMASWQVSQTIISLVESPDGTEVLSEAGVVSDTVAAYRNRLSQGGAVLMVKAGYKPLGVAKITRRVSAEMGATPIDSVVEEVVIRDTPDYGAKVFRDHPLFLTRPQDPEATNFHMANWPIPLISRRKPGTFSIIGQHARMASWPFPLISHGKPFTFSLFEPHARMANWPIPLISHRKPKDRFAFQRHARMANFPIPLISRRKPYTGTWIGKHPRMANWPFPHLINGTANNSLMPGAPRMANFPISLLSDRKPYTGSIFGPHARMANFPIPLISRRKPKDRFAFQRHARMANYFLPLIAKPFTVSGLLGIPTLSSR